MLNSLIIYLKRHSIFRTKKAQKGRDYLDDYKSINKGIDTHQEKPRSFFLNVNRITTL